MRQKSKSLEDVKREIALLQGKAVKISVNRGRNKTEKYNGEVENTYPNLFVLRIDGDEHVKNLSCSYQDVICGDVRLKAGG